MADNQDERLFEMLFDQLVMSLNEAAMIQLGKIINPASGKIERSLPQAQGTIDLLRMLKAKTQGNLSQREQQLLDQSVMTLQLNYVYEAEQSAKQPQGPDGQSAAGAQAGGAEDEETEEAPGAEPGSGQPQPGKTH